MNKLWITVMKNSSFFKRTYLTKNLICLSIVLSLLAAVNANADATLSYQSLNGKFNFQVKNQLVYVKNIDQGTDIVFEESANHVIIINHNKGTYSVLNEAEMQNIDRQIGGLKDTLTSGLSSDQREQLNEFLGGALGPEPNQAAKQYSINAIGGAKVGNFECQQSEVFENNQSLGYICVANAQQLSLNSADYLTLIAFQKFAVKANNLLRKSIGSALQVELPNLENTNINELLIFSQLQEPDQADFYLEQVNTKAIAEVFSIPNNYKQESVISSINLSQF